jgi:hypothetical protein
MKAFSHPDPSPSKLGCQALKKGYIWPNVALPKRPNQKWNGPRDEKYRAKKSKSISLISKFV